MDGVRHVHLAVDGVLGFGKDDRFDELLRRDLVDRQLEHACDTLLQVHAPQHVRLGGEHLLHQTVLIERHVERLQDGFRLLGVLGVVRLRPDSSYNLVLTNTGLKEVDLLCEIVDAKGDVKAQKGMKVAGNNLATLNFNLAHLTRDDYKLKVLDQRTRELLNATDLEYVERRSLVLFQTDKPRYKPGDRVQFRVIFLLSDTKPVSGVFTPTVYITNPDRIRIKQWTNATLTNGVFVGSFQLAEYTSPGRWTINAMLNRKEYKDTFRVEEYTLPLYDVEIQSVPNSYFLCTNKNMTLKISAEYPNGGLVRGKAVVVVRANYNNYPSETKEVHRAEVPIAGSATIGFDTNLVAKNCDEEYSVWFDVEVTESMTKISYNTTKSFTIYNSRGVTMELLDANDAFYPGAPLKLKILLTTIDEKPLTNATILIKYKTLDENQHDIENAFAQIVTSSTNLFGISKVTINTKPETSRVVVEGTYQNQTFWLLDASPMYEDEQVEYLAANTLQAYYSVTRNVTIEFYSNVKVKQIFYVAYCRGAVCQSGSIEASNSTKQHRLEFKATPKMLPKMNLLAFTVKEDGKILSTTIPVRVLPSSRTFGLTYSLTKENDGMYNFNITAEKGAFVGLLGVDQRVNQHEDAASNDITWQKLDKILNSQEDESTLWSFYDSFGRVAKLSEEETFEKVRANFPETWIWEHFTAPNGVFSLNKSIPDTATTWMVTGFSVGPQNGLQIVRAPLRIKPRKKRIIAQLHAPPSIKRFEMAIAYCLVHNFDKAANVTLEVSSMRPQRLYLPEGATESVKVNLLPKTLDALTVNVTVKNTKGKVIDMSQYTIPVRPEGVQRTVEDVRLVVYPSSTSENFTLRLPVIEGDRNERTGVTTLSVIGTFLNLNLFDLEDMVRSSHGNGEESLLFLQTAMAVYDYQLNSNRLSAESRNKLISYMEVAYQQLLRYRLDDGSFSMFGSMYQCGGIWFTASSVESLCKLSTYMIVQQSVITDGLRWLAQQSTEDGRFNETCTVAHPHIQRTGGMELSLASSVMFAFASANATNDYAQLMNKTISLLLTAPGDDVYLLAKTCYLLTLLKHSERFKKIETLNKRAVLDGVYRYWNVTNRLSTSSPDLRDQETTAYALLANLKVNQLTQLELIQVAQWIERHSFTGDLWESSLEKVLALQALGTLVDNIRIGMPSMSITVENQPGVLQINSSNQQLQQTITLPKGTASIKVSARGTGLALIRLTYRYSELSAPASSTNSKGLEVNKSFKDFALHIYWCYVELRPWRSYESPLMRAVIILPTGFEVAELIQTNQHIENLRAQRGARVGGLPGAHEYQKQTAKTHSHRAR
uniref:TEP1-F n=1 Tax=Anopheles farauti TaxID=69004 RepID=A0A182QCY6_9DIPT